MVIYAANNEEYCTKCDLERGDMIGTATLLLFESLQEIGVFEVVRDRII